MMEYFAEIKKRSNIRYVVDRLTLPELLISSQSIPTKYDLICSCCWIGKQLLLDWEADEQN